MNVALGAPGRIGPNAVTRLAEALTASQGGAAARRLFDQAGLLHHLLTPPDKMVDERDVLQLHRVMRDTLGDVAAAELARAAGQRTAAYLLAHRIPKPLQAVLRHTPAALAARVLLSAIQRNAWTFVGSGRFTVQPGRPWVLRIHDNPLCRGVVTASPSCDFYTATFQSLFTALVHPKAQVVEVACESSGDSECRFEVSW